MQASGHPDPSAGEDGEPTPYGPQGYLPQRAARRARKIILRAEMGLGWPLAAVGAGVLLLVVGVAFVLLRTGPPAAPFMPVAQVEAVDPRGAAMITDDLVAVRASGVVRVLSTDGRQVVWCAASGALEDAGGGVWNATGRRIGGGGDSLVPIPSEVHRGAIYADPTRPGTPAPPEDRGASPACADASG